MSIEYWCGENWFAYNVIAIPNLKQDWNILVCQLARHSHTVGKIYILNCPILVGSKCFVYKHRVVSLFVHPRSKNAVATEATILHFLFAQYKICARANQRVLIYIPSIKLCVLLAIVMCRCHLFCLVLFISDFWYLLKMRIKELDAFVIDNPLFLTARHALVKCIWIIWPECLPNIGCFLPTKTKVK